LLIFSGSLFRASAAIISIFVTPKKLSACFNQGVQKSEEIHLNLEFRWELLGNAKFQIQYQIQTNAGITTFTAGCNNERTCNLMNSYVSEMIKSIR
jgi:hypothetical protein